MQNIDRVNIEIHLLKQIVFDITGLK